MNDLEIFQELFSKMGVVNGGVDTFAIGDYEKKRKPDLYAVMLGKSGYWIAVAHAYFLFNKDRKFIGTLEDESGGFFPRE